MATWTSPCKMNRGPQRPFWKLTKILICFILQYARKSCVTHLAPPARSDTSAAILRVVFLPSSEDCSSSPIADGSAVTTPSGNELRSRVWYQVKEDPSGVGRRKSERTL